MRGAKERNRGRSRGRNFMSGILVLSLSTFIVKLIGLAYKIPMISLLGAEGMGYFNSAYEIYALLCVISTAGLPVALSMLVSQSRERRGYRLTERIYRCAMAIFLLLGASGSIIMFVFSEELSALIENQLAAASIAAISPALLCVCISSAIRGYFQGFCRMVPTALSQLIEAIGKLVLGVAFASAVLERGKDIAEAAAAAIVGLSIGTLLSALYLIWAKHRHNKQNRELVLNSCEDDCRYSGISGRLFKIAIPITLGSAALSVTRITDMALIMRRLRDIGYSAMAANEIYGSYTTLAVPMFSLIPSLITPVALALVPSLSASIERGSEGDQSEVAGAALRITAFFAMPASAGIALYAEPILKLLFRGQSEAVSVAAPLLALLAPSILFSCIISTTNAVLQSYRKTVIPIISMAAGAAVKIISAYALIGIPTLGVYGAPLSTLFCNLTITAVNLYFVNKTLPVTEGVSGVYFRPFAASAAMILTSYAAYIGTSALGFGEILSFGVALSAALFSYFLFALCFGALGREDILMLPAGDKILKIVNKAGFVRPQENK